MYIYIYIYTYIHMCIHISLYISIYICILLLLAALVIGVSSSFLWLYLFARGAQAHSKDQSTTSVAFHGLQRRPHYFTRDAC